MGRSLPGRPADPPADQGCDPDADPVSVAKTICLRLLTARARSRAELAQALADRAVPEDAARHVLDRFVEVGLINDAEYARSFVTARHADRGLARREIARQLADRGIAADLVTEALAGIDDEQEDAAARRMAQRKLRSMAALGPDVKRRRLVALLARKGYPSSLCYRVARDLVAEVDDTVTASAEHA